MAAQSSRVAARCLWVLGLVGLLGLIGPGAAWADFTVPNVSEAFHAHQAMPQRVDLDILAAGMKGTGVVSGAACSAQGSPDMTVAVATGVVKVGDTIVAVTSGNVTITTAHATNPRLDLVVANNSGTKSVTAGTAAATPLLPNIPASSVVLCAVYVPANDTTMAANQITDKRAIVSYQLLAGTISPAQLTANQNDWAPTDCATSTTVRFSADQARLITGLSCGQVAATVRVLQNVGTAEDSIVILKSQSTSSTAANRFALDSDVTLGPNDSVALWYDAADSRWRQFAIDARFDQSFRRMPHYSTDFLGQAGADTKESIEPWNWVAVSSGTQSVIAGTAQHPGIARLVSSTTANGGSYIQTAASAMLFGGGERTEIVMMWQNLSTTTVRFGFLDSVTSADAVDGAYIEIPTTGAAVCKTANNSTRTTSATIATLVTGTWYHLKISVDATAANVTCQIFDDNGNSLGSQTNSANIPTTAGREFANGITATESTTTATNMVDIDYLALWWERALTRGR